ncbi:MAG: hypothetical protein DDT40_00148 [candidate division WS2 bacterium]|nr:hypothetical protein [Candidatus Psychracetigena formicireducens]
MSKIFVKRSVLLKAVVDESLKKELMNQLQDNQKKIDMEIERLKYQSNKLLIESPMDIRESMAIRKRVEEEKRDGELLKDQILQKVKEVNSLDLGSIYPIGVIEGLAELKVGDNLWNKVNNCEIIIKDGIIEEIHDQ